MKKIVYSFNSNNHPKKVKIFYHNKIIYALINAVDCFIY